MGFPTILPGASWIGGGFLNLQTREKTRYKRNGIIERTSIFMSQGYPINPPLPRFTPYPDQATGGFICDDTLIENLPGGYYRTTVVWVAIWSANVSYVTYDSKLIQVPIDQSPDFIDIAGTPDDALNGAIFDSNGIFVGFAAGSQYQGVVSAFIQQDLMVIHGSGTSPAVPNGINFCESVVNTLRGNVWEYEVTYNLDINIETGLPMFDNGE